MSSSRPSVSTQEIEEPDDLGEDCACERDSFLAFWVFIMLIREDLCFIGVMSTALLRGEIDRFSTDRSPIVTCSSYSTLSRDWYDFTDVRRFTTLISFS